MTQTSANRIILVYVDTPSPVCFGTCGADRDLPADDVALAGGTIIGRGILIEVPTFRLLTGGVAERWTVTLANCELTTAWLDDPESGIVGAAVYLGVLELDSAFQPVGTVDWYSMAYANVAAIDDMQEGEPVTLACSTEFMDRSRAGLAAWSDAAHRVAHPTDAFFSEVGLNGFTKTFIW